MIPGYRIRIYCFFFASLFLLTAWVIGQEIYRALTIFQLKAYTGLRPYRVWEHLVFDEQPWRFSFYFVFTVAVFIFSSWAGLFLTWGVLRGRKAFKRWSR